MSAKTHLVRFAVAAIAVPLLAVPLARLSAAAAASPSVSRYRVVHHRLGDGRTYGLQLEQSAIKVRRPLMLLLPGLGETEAQMDADASGYLFGRTHGITIAYGRQLADRGGTLSWNAGGCCGLAAADDVTYLRQVVSDVERWTDVDRHRVYVVGMSNGGMMALRTVCAAPDIFAAAGSVAGPLLQATCRRPIWRHLHGSSDTIVPVHGGRTAWNPLPFPDTTTEAARFGGFASVDVVSGAQHTWPRLGDGTWNLDGLSDIWAHLAPFHL